MHVQGTNFDQAQIQTAFNKRGYNDLLAFGTGLQEWDLARFIFKVDEIERFNDGGQKQQ